MGAVVRLFDRTASVAEGPVQLVDWAQTWLDHIRDGALPELRSIIIVMESKDGGLATVAQSIGAMDKARLVGLLTLTAHQKADGGAAIEDLK